MRRLILCFVTLSMTWSLSTQARGANGSGGGDICEDRIKIIRDDIKSWVEKGGARGLQLSVGISYEKYVTAMLNQIEKSKIRCLGRGDHGYPISIGATPKVCRFDRRDGSSQITCDFEKFTSMEESDQYVLVHHEYAGLAHIEKPDGDRSDYGVSNQISTYLEDQIVKKLAVKQNSRASNEWRIGAFVTPKKEILRCTASKQILGHSPEIKKITDVEVSYPNDSGPRDIVLLEVDGLLVVLGTYAAGLELYVIPVNVKRGSLNNLVQSSTSRGPIEDSHWSKLSLSYQVTSGTWLQAFCSYVDYK